MELLYLYIHNFRKIKEQSFVFSADINFELTKEKNHESRLHLHLSYNKEYIDIFPDKILNITGIVGKNGAGKTTLLDCLKLFSGNFQRLETPIIYSLRDNDSGIIYTYNTIDQNVQNGYSTIRLSYDNLLPSKYEVAEIQSLDSQYENRKGTPLGLNETAACFFTNSFHNHSEIIYDGLYNLSTNSRLDAYINTNIEKKLAEARKNSESISLLNDFHKQELRSMISFLSYAKSRTTHKIPNLPETLVVTFNFDDYLYLTSNSNLKVNPNLKKLKTFHPEMIERILKRQNPIQKFQSILTLCLYYHLIRWHLPGSEDTVIERLFRFMDLTVPYNVNELDTLMETMLDLEVLFRMDRAGNFRRALSPDFIMEFKNLKFRRHSTKGEQPHFEIEINNNLWPLMSDLYNFTELQEINFIDYQWGGGLSTGQEAFITHFSRLHDIKNKIGQKDIWLFIDEGDLHFHPEMQKEYFSQLLKFTQFLFGRNQVQIILSTHSPFIVSDLPKQNLLFLKADANGNCIVDNDNIAQETFGANIHDLFKDTLFLSGGLIGDFAKEKIQDVIDWCNAPDKKELKKASYYKKLVEKIGEPIIRQKLIEMIAKKLGEDQELARLKEQQEIIRKRIAEINSKDDLDKN